MPMRMTMIVAMLVIFTWAVAVGASAAKRLTHA
jgi:hypothetical protein